METNDILIGSKEEKEKNRSQKLANKLKSKKTKRFVRWFTIIFTVLFFTTAFLVPRLFEGTFIADVIQQDVLGVINIFHFFETNLNTIFRTITTLLLYLVLLYVILFIVRLFMRGSQRQRTIVTLIASFIRYLGAIIIFMVLLGIWGVDTGTLLAGVGALALIIGFGAQSLIADILAGLFIVFENAFQVDDIISIDGFRGTVVEIGLRTTRIQDPLGDIKTINNSELKTFVNMSREKSSAIVEVTIDYGENLERVEKLIQNNLEAIRSKLPAVTEPIKYLGPASFTERGTLLKLCAHCLEQDRLQLVRDFNREIKLLLDKNFIKIAVPQVKVKQGV